jgi:hypothetical protein
MADLSGLMDPVLVPLYLQNSGGENCPRTLRTNVLPHLQHLAEHLKEKIFKIRKLISSGLDLK